jgi:hypothetical protein
VTVTTYLVPPQTTTTPYHTRLHHVVTARPLIAVDGGWAIHSHTGPSEHSERRLPVVSSLSEDTDGSYTSPSRDSAIAVSKAGISGVINLASTGKAVVLDVDGSSNLIAPRTVIPAVRTEVAGDVWLASRIWGVPAKEGRLRGWMQGWDTDVARGKRGIDELVKELGISV